MDTEPSALLDLPEHVCDEVLKQLGRDSFSTVALVCKKLRQAVHRDSLWVQLCEQRWNDHTSVHSWLEPMPGSVFNDLNLASVRPVNFRGVYQLLELGSDLVGLWRTDPGTASKGTELLHFSWQHDCIQGRWLSFNSITLPAVCSKACSFSSRGKIVPEFLPTKGYLKSRCLLKECSAMSPGQRQRQSSAEAAASVAIPSINASASLLGSSPEGSFESEMVKFMETSVAPKKARKRSSNRSSSPGLPSGGSPNARTSGGRYIMRVQRPVPTRQHPLSGLWKGDLGKEGVHVFSICSDFSGPAARISAVQITGADPDQPVWLALAAPVPEPWNEHETALIEMREAIVNDELQPEAIDFESSGSSLGQYFMPPHTEVQRCFEGKRFLGRRSTTRSRWVDGRLWVYGPDHIGFLWLEGILPWAATLLDMIRISDEFER